MLASTPLNFTPGILTSVAQYGSTLIPGKSLALLRGSGLYNPPSNYEQSTYRGPAYDQALNVYSFSNPDHEPSNNSKWPNQYAPLDKDNKHPFVVGSTSFHPEDPNSWNKPDYKNSRGSDRYQIWASQSTNMVPSPLMNYFFSEDNVNHLQNTLKSEIMRIRGIVVSDQSVDEILIIMRNKYLYALSGYLPLSMDDTVYPRGTPKGEKIGSDGSNAAYSAYWNAPDSSGSCMSLEFQIAQLNQAVLEELVKQVLSGIDAYKQYYKDASTLALPLSQPILTTMKGTRELQTPVGLLYSPHDMNKALASYENRYNVI